MKNSQKNIILTIVVILIAFSSLSNVSAQSIEIIDNQVSVTVLKPLTLSVDPLFPTLTPAFAQGTETSYSQMLQVVWEATGTPGQDIMFDYSWKTTEDPNSGTGVTLRLRSSLSINRRSGPYDVVTGNSYTDISGSVPGVLTGDEIGKLYLSLTITSVKVDQNASRGLHFFTQTVSATYVLL